MDPELTALTSAVAATVVQLLATAAWERARSAVGALWRRVHPERAATVEAELTESRTAVLAARQTGNTKLEEDLVSGWSTRLELLMSADPQLVQELRQVVAQLRPLLADPAPQGATITMKGTASGHGRVYQAARDLHISER